MGALAALGVEVSEDSIKKILSSVGIEADGEKVALVVKELAGKNLEEVIAAGTEKLGSVPSVVAQLLLLPQLLVVLLLLQLPPLLLLPRRRARRKMMTWASDSLTKSRAILRSQLDKLCHPQIVPCCLK